MTHSPTSERLKDHADWLQDRADNPSTVAPGSPDPRSIVDSKRLGEIAKDIREYIEDVEDEASLRGAIAFLNGMAIDRADILK